ncbi:hypothetical protein GEMRC1_001682 [Eukaryota sp. GEM-RC1]
MALAVKRIAADLRDLQRLEGKTILVHPGSDVYRCTALIVGPSSTPYAFGFFYFSVKFPADYPFNPPKMISLTNDSNRVRFNPNLYADGKICLSILGTWSGPSWVATMTLKSVLLSIQGLILTNTPLHNEPGWESETDCNKLQGYNNMLLHETLRVAVCDTVENPPPEFADEIRSQFAQHFDEYVSAASSHTHLNGSRFQDPYRSSSGVFDFDSILRRLDQLKERFC